MLTFHEWAWCFSSNLDVPQFAANNLRQIGVAAHTYTGDSQELMPPNANPEHTALWRWQDYLAPYCGGVESASKHCFCEIQNVGMAEVHRGKGVFSCPSMSSARIVEVDYFANQLPNGGARTMNHNFDYGLNEHLASHRLRDVSRVRQAGRPFAFMDMNSRNYGKYDVQGASSGICMQDRLE